MQEIFINKIISAPAPDLRRLRLQISTGSATLVFRNHLVFGQVPEVTGYFLAEISLWLLFFGLGCF